MAATTRTPRQGSAQHVVEQGIIASSVTRLIQALVFLLLTLCFSILIEWLGMATGYWEQPGSQHSERMLATELSYLHRDFRRSAIVEQPASFVRQFSDRFYELSIQKTGIQAAILWLSKPTTPSSQLRQHLQALYRGLEDYLTAALTVVRIFAVRLAVLALAMPAFVLLALLGLIDGLVQRDIRRWSGGRESSFVYHWAKKAFYPSLILPWIIYLAIPESVHPNWVVLPFAVSFGISVRVMASMFKKYL